MDLLIDPARGRCRRRTDHDQNLGLAQRRADRGRQIARRRQIITVAKNGVEAFRDNTLRSRTADEIAGQAIGLQGAVNTARPAAVFMAITDKCPVFRLPAHNAPAPKPGT